MRFKSTLILFIVFLGLGSYVYLAEYRGRDEREKKEQAAKKVFQIEEKDVKEITLIYPDRTIAAVKKGEKQWEMTSPAGVEADPDEWDRLASNIAGVEKESTVASENADLAQFGLDKPSVTVRAKLADGRDIGLLFGAENPKKTFNYVKLDSSSEVFLSPSSWSGFFKKSVADMRNKKLLNFETENIDAIRIADAKGGEIALQKSGTEWMLKKPIEGRADDGEASSFLSSISFARAADFADSVDAKTSGLDAPSIRITLHDSKAGADRTLLIGKAKETDKYYAKDASRPAIFVIEKEIPEKARRPLFDWRDKTIAKVASDKVDEIEVIRGAEKFSAKKTGEEWKLPDGRKLQGHRISSMISSLDFERARQIIDAPKALSAYGLDKPKMEVFFREAGKEVLSLKFGGNSKDPEGVYLKTSTSPAVVVAASTVSDSFNVKAEDLVESPPAGSSSK